MTDLELLEMAAKAAGYDYRSHGGYIVVNGIPGNWNPITNDGDALRLAVALSLRVECREDGHSYVWRGEVLLFNDFALHEGSPDERESATRRAIVRAAAEIGKSM